MHFFKQKLTRMDTYYVLIFNDVAMVICWEDGDCWRAKLTGARSDGGLISTTGRTPREALRKLEKKTLLAIRAFVSTFAAAFREAGIFFKKALGLK